MNHTKNESLPELQAADDPIVQMRMVVQTARANDALISRTWVSGWADKWEKERAAALTREAPPETAIACDHCDGVGRFVEPTVGEITCKACNGRGFFRISSRPAAPQRLAQGVDYDEIYLLLQSARSNIGARRPDYDENDANHWDRLSAAMESVKAASLQQPSSIHHLSTQPPHQKQAAPVTCGTHEHRGDVERDRLAYALNNMKGFFKRDSEQWDALDKAAAALTEAKQHGPGEAVAVVTSTHSPVFEGERLFDVRVLPEKKWMLEKLGDGALLYTAPQVEAKK